MPAPIPIPFKQRLHDLRVRLVPVLIFVVTILVAASLWRDTVAPSMLVGEVASAQSTVTSPVTAMVQELKVRRFDTVQRGDVIAELSPIDPRQALDVLQGEIGLFKIKADADTARQSQDRVTLDYEKLALDLMSEKVALVLAQAKAKKTAMDLDVARGLVTDPSQAQRFTQEAQLAKESADAEVKERESLVTTLAKRVTELSTLTKTSSDAVQSLMKSIASFESRLHEIERTQSSVKLQAPITGMVTAVLHRAGENVRQGDPVVVITSSQPESIVGYLKQPLPLEPAIGQEVEVRTRDRNHQPGTAFVKRVGVQFEPIINPALHPATTTPEVGLPVEITLPTGMKLRPGELVSLVIRTHHD